MYLKQFVVAILLISGAAVLIPALPLLIARLLRTAPPSVAARLFVARLLLVVLSLVMLLELLTVALLQNELLFL